MRHIILAIMILVAQASYPFPAFAQVTMDDYSLDFKPEKTRIIPPSEVDESELFRTPEEIKAQGIEQYENARAMEKNDPVNAYRNYIFASYNYHKGAKKKYRRLEKKLAKEQIGEVAYEVASIIAVTMNGTIEKREINVWKTLKPNQMYEHKIDWLEKAAKNNNTLAMLDLAEDRSNMQRGRAATKLLERAAELGNLDAEYQLAIRYLYGNGVDKDRQMARELIETLAAQDHKPSKVALNSIDYFPEVLAEKGNMEAQNVMGTKLYKDALINMIVGRYGTKDRTSELFTQSRNWFDKAAEQGSGYAMHFLAMYSYYGLGTERNTAHFVEWLKKASQTDYVPAQFNIGYLIERGIGFVKSEQKSIDIYTKSANDGFVGAQSVLGRLYKSGELVGKDLEKSIYWLEKAAEQNDRTSQYLLCTYYSEGPEEARDYAKAYKWLRIFTSGQGAFLPSSDGIDDATPHMVNSVRIIAPNITPEEKENTEKAARAWVNDHPVIKQLLLTTNFLGIYREVDFHVW